MIEIKSDRISFGGCDYFPCLTYACYGSTGVMVRDRLGNSFNINSLTCPDYADQDAIIADLEAANAELCGNTVEIDEINYTGITNQVYCRLSDQKKVIIRECKLEDGTVEIKDTDSNTVLTDAQLASDYDAECAASFEKCFPFTRMLKDGECITLQDVLNGFPTGLGIAGFDFDLKPVNGDSFDGFVATTSDATMEGPHGDHNFDGGGGHKINPERQPDNTFNKLDLTQKFCVAKGSVGSLAVSIILP